MSYSIQKYEKGPELHIDLVRPDGKGGSIVVFHSMMTSPTKEEIDDILLAVGVAKVTLNEIVRLLDESNTKVR